MTKVSLSQKKEKNRFFIIVGLIKKTCVSLLKIFDKKGFNYLFSYDIITI